MLNTNASLHHQGLLICRAVHSNQDAQKNKRAQYTRYNKLFCAFLTCASSQDHETKASHAKIIYNIKTPHQIVLNRSRILPAFLHPDAG